MRTDVRRTSLEAYDAIHADGSAATKAAAVARFVRANPNVSRQDITRATGISINCVCGRVKELLDDDVLEEYGDKIDPVSQKRVATLRVKPAQRELGLS